jgi:hypothetical protein
MRFAALRCELPPFSEKQGCLVLRIAHTSEVQYNLGAHGCSVGEVLRCLRERVQEFPNPLPVPERLGRIVEPYPLGRSPMPLRRFPSIARLLPVVGEQRRALAELPRIDLLDRARGGGVDAGSSLGELRAVGDFLGQRVLEGVLGLRIERLFVEILGGGRQTCPMNFLIYRGRCLPAVEGPITEYGCVVRQNGAGEVVAQTCPNSRMAIVGNVGLPGAPLQGFTGYGVGPSFVSGFAPVAIGVTTVVAPRAGRRWKGEGLTTPAVRASPLRPHRAEATPDAEGAHWTATSNPDELRSLLG